MTTVSELKTPQITASRRVEGLVAEADEEKAGSLSGIRRIPDPDLLKQFVRTVFEREFLASQRWQEDPEPSTLIGVSNSIDQPMRSLLGKRYPELRKRSRWYLARLTRRSRMHLLKIRIMRELYRAIFEHTLVEEELELEAVALLEADELRRRLASPLRRNLLSLFGWDSNPRTQRDQFEKVLDQFDRQIQGWLEWCVSLLPYHAPALGDQDPHAILVRASQR